MSKPQSMQSADGTSMETQTEKPAAETRFLVTRYVIHAFVICCPFCFGQHRHGGSSLWGDPRDIFESPGRVSHCRDRDRGHYWLVPSGLPAFFEDRRARRRSVIRHLEELGIPYCDEFLIKPRPRRRRRDVW
jgi:hypothetical protein